jgi:hypothetical protein
VCRCPGCAKYYCRECVTEHDDRLICAACLRKLTGSRAPKRAFSAVMGAMWGFAGLLLVWLFFYYAGQVLILMPAAMHEGTVWQR